MVETRNARLLDLAFEPILVRDGEDRITYWNRGAERLYGFSREEALGRVSHDLLKTTFPEPFEQVRSSFLAARQWQGELVHTTRDGQEVLVSSRWAMDDNPATGLLILETNFDLTALRSSRAALEASEHRLRSVFQLSPLGIGIRNEGTSRFEMVNEAYSRITGYSESELLSQGGIDSPAKTESELRLYGALLAGLLPLYQTERALQRKDGSEIWIALFVRVLDNQQDGTKTMVLLEDITARRSAELDIHALNTTLERRIQERTHDLEESNRDLEAFSYSVSHDLRAPLRAIRGFADALEEDFGDKLDEQAMSYLRHIERGSTRLTQLIDDLLAYGRLGRSAISLSPVLLGDAVDRAVRQLPNLTPLPEIKVPAQLAVAAHTQTLTQVLVNLLSNAAKFTRPDVETKISITAEPRGEMIRLWVEDNGIGIAPAHQERIFQVFERLHGQEAYPGTGIGLAIVRRAMERLHGNAGVQSELGSGSRFWVELPRVGVA